MDTIEVTVRVPNADEAGAVTLAPEPPWLDAPLVASLADPDGGVSAENWSWSRGDSASGPFLEVAGATSATYTP